VKGPSQVGDAMAFPAIEESNRNEIYKILLSGKQLLHREKVDKKKSRLVPHTLQ
jgi:hypothetical protein